MVGSLAHEIVELLRLERLERESRAQGQEPTQAEQLRLWTRRRQVYFRIAQECHAEGDTAGMAEANRAAGQAVTMVHRLAELGICSACGAVEFVDWAGVTADDDLWHCRNCGRRWATPRGAAASR